MAGAVTIKAAVPMDVKNVVRNMTHSFPEMDLGNAPHVGD
jgi:hypothetical protein